MTNSEAIQSIQSIKIVLAGADRKAVMSQMYPAFNRSETFTIVDVVAIGHVGEVVGASARAQGPIDFVIVRADVAGGPDVAFPLLDRLAARIAANTKLLVALPSGPAWAQRVDDVVALPGVIACLTEPVDWNRVAARLSSGRSMPPPTTQPQSRQAQPGKREEMSDVKTGETSVSIRSANADRPMAQPTRPTVRVGFYGERGGVGVSTAAWATARALAESGKGKRVALFDATGRGDLHLMAGLNPGAEAVSNGGITFFLSAPTEERALGFDAVVIDGGRERGRFNAEWHSISRPLDEDEILRLPVRRTQTGLAGVEREGEEIEIEKKGKPSPGRGGLLSNLKLGNLFSIEVTS